MTPSPRIICLGHAAHDFIYRVPAIPAQPVKVIATGFDQGGGGMAANAAVAIARLGGKASYWGRVADDALGERILAELAGEGVDVDNVRRIRGCASPVNSILVTDRGERLICSYSDPGLDPDPAWLPLAEIAASDAVLADVRWPAGAARILDAARDAGRPGLLDADVGPKEVLDDLAPRASHLLFSELGLATWTGDAASGAALRRAARATHRVVGVTLGAQGFLWLDQGAERRLPAPQVRAVDTLAAGDVWHGAFALAIAEGRPVETAAAFANAAAALKCEQPGGRRGAPRRAAVEALLAQGGSLK